jgi:8-amino-7-oxononanoate synthase
MPALDDILEQKLQLLAAKHQRRALVHTFREEGVVVARAGKRLISFSCNDYYGLSQHPKVIEAAVAATQKYGAGAGASRLVTGNHALYEPLEEALAEYCGAEAALVFGSGYLTNLGVIPALVGKNDVILADKFIHACMLDAARLSGATLLRFSHNNVAHLRMLLEANRGEYQHCLILTESVFSMDGDCAPMAEIQAIAGEFDGWVMLDGAHSLWDKRHGMKDERISVHPSSINPSSIFMGTLSKSLGSYGGYVCGSKVLREYLVNAARSMVFSTGLPPASCTAALAALEILAHDVELQQKPLKHAQYFTQLMGLPLAQSAIVPMVLGENEKALKASAHLAENGFLVAAIRPPTVPENTARLRFTFSALHSQEQIERVAGLLKECME